MAKQLINDIVYHYKLDICGMRCPDPLMFIRKFIRDITLGDNLLIIADDISTIHDVPNFCHFMGHILLFKQTNILPYQFLIKKIK
ncbi:MAG: sulfurtransferase TusA [Pantoea sp. Brub]|nr:sulfurtransferase TusA [Pantoea sp. Brub]